GAPPRAIVVPMGPHPQVSSQAQARYAHLRALVQLRIAELEAALERHEANRANWAHAEPLLAVEAGVGTLVELFAEREHGSVPPIPSRPGAFAASARGLDAHPDARAPHLVTFPPPLAGI